MAYGSLTFICGPMFGGKTTDLVRRILHARRFARHGTHLVLKPAFDSRFGASRIATHEGLAVDAVAITAMPDEARDVGEVFLDEVQFCVAPHYKGDVVEDIRDLLMCGVCVTASGLDMDSRGKPFEVSAALSAMADNLVKHRSWCSACGNPATKSQRRAAGGDRLMLGEADLYEPRCNEHWSPA